MHFSIKCVNFDSEFTDVCHIYIIPALIQIMAGVWDNTDKRSIFDNKTKSQTVIFKVIAHQRYH